MVPKLHAKGTSFKGAAAYLLHDKDRAQTDERVAWTETRNLAVDDPDLAWRIMAATAMDQDRLKAEAGVKNTGRKSDKHVLHLTLSWHPEQTPSREEMLSAADGALAALSAGDRQALIIAHKDEAHAHLHMLINRVSPIDGRQLSSSQEKLKLSEWAEAYEKATGIYCENRIINNAMRERGEYVRGEKDQARHIFEAQQAAAANDNDRAQAVIAEQKAKDHALALKGRALAESQAEEWQKLERDHHERRDTLAHQLARDVEKARAQVLEEFRPALRALNRHQAAERETFEALETTLFGRASNIVKTIRLSADMVTEGEGGIISRSFRILANAGERKAYFERAQERVREDVQRQQDAKADEAENSLKAQLEDKLAANRAAFAGAREELIKAQAVAQEVLKLEWKARTAERTGALEAAARQSEARADLLSSYGQAAGTPLDERQARYLERNARLTEFRRAAEPPSNENSKDRSLGREDD